MKRWDEKTGCGVMRKGGLDQRREDRRREEGM